MPPRGGATTASGRTRKFSSYFIQLDEESQRVDRIIKSIILANVFIYANFNYPGLFPLSPKFLNDHFVASTNAIFGEGPKRYHTLLTSTFSHVDGMHLLVNMVTFYFFGRSAMRVLGPRLGLALYFTSGTFASFAQLYVAERATEKKLGKAWTVPYYRYLEPPTKVIGASGAVTAMVSSSSRGRGFG